MLQKTQYFVNLHACVCSTKIEMLYLHALLKTLFAIICRDLTIFPFRSAACQTDVRRSNRRCYEVTTALLQE